MPDERIFPAIEEWSSLETVCAIRKFLFEFLENGGKYRHEFYAVLDAHSIEAEVHLSAAMMYIGLRAEDEPRFKKNLDLIYDGVNQEVREGKVYLSRVEQIAEAGSDRVEGS